LVTFDGLDADFILIMKTYWGERSEDEGLLLVALTVPDARCDGAVQQRGKTESALSETVRRSLTGLDRH
jgi:hypothetical protein